MCSGHPTQVHQRGPLGLRFKPTESQLLTTFYFGDPSVAPSLCQGDLLSTKAIFWIDIPQLRAVSQKQNCRSQKARPVHLETPELWTLIKSLLPFWKVCCLCAKFYGLNSITESVELGCRACGSFHVVFSNISTISHEHMSGDVAVCMLLSNWRFYSSPTWCHY